MLSVPFYNYEEWEEREEENFRSFKKFIYSLSSYYSDWKITDAQLTFKKINF